MALEKSILNTTKKVLNVPPTLTAFDQDILLHINSALSILDELGVGPSGGFTVDDETIEWTALGLPSNQQNLLKTYLYLKVRLLFDPPGTSFGLAAMERQVSEHEWRLRTFVEDVTP